MKSLIASLARFPHHETGPHGGTVLHMESQYNQAITDVLAMLGNPVTEGAVAAAMWSWWCDEPWPGVADPRAQAFIDTARAGLAPLTGHPDPQDTRSAR